MTVSNVIELACNFRINTVIFEPCFGGFYFIKNTAHGNDTQDWDFFGFDFEICIISLLVMSKY